MGIWSHNCAEGNLDLMTADVHEVAALLKLFLCKLPEPLIPPSIGNDMLQAASKSKCRVDVDLKKTEGGDKKERLKILQSHIPSLPQANRKLLSYLLSFLNRVADNSKR